MKIDSIEQQTLDILRNDKARSAAAPKEPAAAAAKEAAAGDQMEPASLDFSKMGEAHTLDPDRVAALIADPLGDA